MNHAQPSVESGHAVPNGVHTRVGDAINGDRPPELTASNNANDTSPKINGNHLHHSHSPAADSPATPISSDAVPDVKIDIDYQEQESDVRHEPVAIKNIELIDKRDVSTVPQVGTPLDPDSIPIHPPHGTPPPQEGDLLEDVKMAEHVPNGINSNHTNGTDVEMSDATPTPTPGLQQDSSMTTLDDASSSQTRPASYDDDEGPPPAKRARMHSDADKASFAHSATPPPASAAASDTAGSPAPPPPSSTAPPPTSASTPPPYTGRPSAFSVAQFRFCQSTVRSLKKLKDATPFLRPVDYVALQIPHYPSIIKHPMDFSTVERKLTSSNPAKPDPNPMNPRYMTTNEFVADVRLIFANTLAFNGPEHAVTLMGKRVEEVFDKQLKHMPPNIEPKPPVVKKVATPPPPPPPAPIKKPIARRPSTSIPVIRRNDQEAIGRPKREIHPPPPKDLPYTEPSKKSKKGKRVKDNGTSEQLKFCGRILQELHRKQHYDIAHPFYEPVDWVKLEIPAYPKIVKKPMDLSTIRRKLDAHEYPTAQKFFDDFKLMIRNCFLFNPAGTPVNQAGIELQRLFDDKWKGLPPLHAVDPSDDEEEDEDDEEEEERQRAIAAMESQIETMRSNLTALKHKAPEKKKKEKKKEKPPVASTSKAPVKQAAKPPTKKSTKKPVADDDVLTFEQKKDLSESISKLDETKLEKVIQIIHEGVPEIRDSTEEIELEIDLLPAAVLTKLYNFVIRPQRQAPAKRSRVGKGGGTGGLKRKSMDEDVEAEKIRQLEERMALFEQGATGAPAPTAPHRDDGSEHSSDDSSDDSSGSDSD